MDVTMRKFVICVYLLSSLFLPSSLYASYSCRQVFSQDTSVVELAGQKELSWFGGSMVLDTLGLVGSVIGTILTAGTAAPIAVASIGVMAGKMGYDGYHIIDPIKQRQNNLFVHSLLNDAEKYVLDVESNSRNTFIDYFNKTFKNETHDIHQKDAAKLLLDLDSKGIEICKIKDMQDFDGKIYFSYLKSDEIAQLIIKHLSP